MKLNFLTKLLVLNYVLAVVMVVFLYVSGIQTSLLNNLYGVLFLGFIPLIGGLNGLILSKHWGYFKSAIGKSIIFLSLGLISWGLGTYIFSGVYNFLLGVAVPYPSIADVGYILSIPLWIMGVLQLAKATGAKYGLRSLKGKSLLLIIPILVIGISYYLLITVARDGVIDTSDSEILKLFFDFAYPVGDLLILTVVTLVYSLSYRYLGGIFKNAVYLILLGFILMYLADFAFSYTTTTETFYPANWVDLLFTTAMFIIVLGVSQFTPKTVNQD
ncbi:MAG: hypothetical protein A3A98_01130 [Candidatus Staskawiczbacteria bacterium RIFCSPLOWO2_01_FULL_40_39]|uniref:Uncharacterized protein n=1 Tax=Candidatus Staskawiczbacteria bacterium RIFCSPHIGHO2_01_FULL_39_25 TaxID=1802202 RepID=A0A1G2HMW7_9BACT|nr:MAG: hypothetical protein A2730_01130 [Candidatus Staskawiczbacteria bacterium RIFCSPHIGHO2_01_FULL_39_25]OGZ73332.1 MAG: hypothetical protein A3A98_01130 [Candidatus Staskawiczbacteria bacterium RIFCSPLOWO2_01_FULL_40_39]